MNDERTDEALVRAAKTATEGDTRAFTELMRRHRGRVLANCRSLSGSEADAPDLALEVFVKAYYALRRFREAASFGTWLQRIKINHCLSHIRRTDRSLVSLNDVSPDEPGLRLDVDADRRAEQIATRDRVWKVLYGLPTNLRIPLVLADMDALPYSEIAEILGLSLSAVKMRVRRARIEFRKRYDAKDETDDVRRSAGS